MHEEERIYGDIVKSLFAANILILLITPRELPGSSFLCVKILEG